MATIVPHTTRSAGTILTAAIYNADHQVHITNANALNTQLSNLGNMSAQAKNNVDITGGAINGVAIGASAAATEAQIDNIKIDGNTIISTDTDGNITLTPNGSGGIVLSKAVTVSAGGAAVTGNSTITGNLTVTGTLTLS